MSPKRRQLSPREEAVLQYVEMRADATAGEIAGALGIRPHAARHDLGSLLEKKLLRRYVQLNIYPLGYFEMGILVALTGCSQQLRAKMVAWCVKHERVNYLLE